MALPSPLSHLRKLFIANVPMNWDIFWIVTLLDAAPVLESCHVHVCSILIIYIPQPCPFILLHIAYMLQFLLKCICEIICDLKLGCMQIDSTPEKASPWVDVQAQEHQYHCLKELVAVNFDAVGWQVGFVRHVMKASPWLRLVHLLDGHIIEDDQQVPGGLEVVPHWREWHECDRSEVLDDLWDGICLPQLKILIGQRNDVV